MTAAERTLYALAWHLRRGDPAARDDLAGMLSPAERAEAQAVLALPGVAETLAGLPEDELWQRMIALAGKSKETRVSEPQREITTILGGSRGAPPIMIRDHGAWEQQVRDEQRRQADEEIKAAVADIERGEQERKFAPRPSLAELEGGARRIAAREFERREERLAVDLELAALEHTITAQLATLPPDPPQPTRYGRPVSTAQLAYERDQLAWQGKQARQAAGAGCGYCNTCRDGGGQFCLFA